MPIDNDLLSSLTPLQSSFFTHISNNTIKNMKPQHCYFVTCMLCVCNMYHACALGKHREHVTYIPQTSTHLQDNYRLARSAFFLSVESVWMEQSHQVMALISIALIPYVMHVIRIIKFTSTHASKY
jgi:hypothetical protein